MGWRSAFFSATVQTLWQHDESDSWHVPATGVGCIQRLHQRVIAETQQVWMILPMQQLHRLALRAGAALGLFRFHGCRHA